MLFQVALFLEDFATNETLDGCCWIMDFANVPFQSTRLGKFRRTMGTGNSSSRLIMVELEKVILLVNKKSFNKRKKVPIYFPIMGNRCHSTLFSTSVTSSHMLFHRALFLEDFATKGTLDGCCWHMDFSNVPFTSTILGKIHRTMGTGMSSSRLIMVEREKGILLLVNNKSFNKRRKVQIYFPI
jgi:hypothetical protein